MSLTTRKRVCCCTLQAELSSTQGVVAVSSGLRRWHDAPPTVTFSYGNETEDGSLGVVDDPCVVGGTPMRITMHVVPGVVLCLLCKKVMAKSD